MSGGVDWCKGVMTGVRECCLVSGSVDWCQAEVTGVRE